MFDMMKLKEWNVDSIEREKKTKQKWTPCNNKIIQMAYV